MKEKKCSVCKKMVDEEEMLWAPYADIEICKKCYEREEEEGALRCVMPVRGGLLSQSLLKKEDEKMSVKLLLDEKFLWVSRALIRAAKKEVYVMAYLMMVPSEKRPGKEAMLYQELMGAQSRGVDCKVLLNYTHPANKIVRQNVLAGRWMGCHGIECRFVARNRTVHAKMIIIDGVTLIIGSHNWSQRAVERNVEASIELKESGIVKEARENFLELWKDAVSIERAH